MIGPGLGSASAWGASTPERRLSPTVPSTGLADAPPSQWGVGDFLRGWFVPTAQDFAGVTGYMKLGALAIVIGGVVYVARCRG